jgi:hypothetical protein
MQLNLNDDEVVMLRDLIEDYLPQLRLEVARTERREYRHGLVMRQELVERLILALEPKAVQA